MAAATIHVNNRNMSKKCIQKNGYYTNLKLYFLTITSLFLKTEELKTFKFYILRTVK